jgi:hypothetical protein
VSGAGALPGDWRRGKADNLVTLRQPNLYADELWRRQRTWALVLPVFGVALLGLSLYSRRGVLDASTLVTLGYIPIGVLWGSALFLNRRRSYVEVTDAGLRFSRMLGSTVLPYDAIRGVRVQKLEMHFQDARKRLVRPMWRPLMGKSALFIRLRADDAMIADVRRRLGTWLTPGLVAEDTIAVPIADPDPMAWEVTSRLPERTGVNLGGQRRRKRPR